MHDKPGVMTSQHPEMMEEEAYPRFESAGRTYVYVLPCSSDTLLKIGFSRDPIRRFLTLHSRFFDFFDLDEGFLIEVEHLRDARRIERDFINAWASERAPAPLMVPKSAAGHTEWFRGIYKELSHAANRLAHSEGLSLHTPLRLWLHQELAFKADLLFSWSGTMLEMIEFATFNRADERAEYRLSRTLKHVLDAYAACNFDLAAILPLSVYMWRKNTALF